jgi:hypothetical protein
MVYKASDVLPVPATSIKDAQWSIRGHFYKTIKRKGFINVLTQSSTMIVNGIVTSNWVDSSTMVVDGVVDDNDEGGWLSISGYTIIHMHSLSPIVYAPHCVVCGHLITCSPGELKENLSSAYFTRYIEKVKSFAMERQSFILTIVLLLVHVILGILFSAIELLLENVLVNAVIIVGGVILVKNLNKKTNAKAA